MLGIGGICEFMGNFVKLRPVVAVVSFLFVLHAANGIRIILVEFCSSVDAKKFLPHLFATTVVIIAVGAFFAFRIATS